MQWIDEADAVFRGGGMKGLALVGALVGFAEHPTKPVRTWKCVAGASDGAIIAAYLATGHDAGEMLELMRRTSFGPARRLPAARQGARRRQASARARDGARKSPRALARCRARRRDLRGRAQARGRRPARPVAAEARRRGRHRGTPARPPRRSPDVPRLAHRAADRAGRLPDRARGKDEHVDPVLLRPCRAGGHAGDERFVSHSTRVRTLAVDADDVATTEFDLSPEKQELLVQNGRGAAKLFLDSFSLEQYENTYHAGLAQNAPVAARF